MDYKEKYEELVEAARAVVEGNPGLCDMNKRLGRVRDLLPEKESEDERIRRWLYDVVDNGAFLAERPCETEKILAYLEKQKEQKPQEQCVDVIKMSASLAADRLASAEMIGRLKERSEIIDNPEKYGLRKPAEWSEEDSRIIDHIQLILELWDSRHPLPNGIRSVVPEYISWLKSLRPQPHWKPSEEQMEALSDAYVEASTFKIGDILESLYNDLKKL